MKTLPAVKKQLTELLKEAPGVGLAGVQVTYGHPGLDHTTEADCYLDGTDDSDTAWANLRGKNDERYSLQMYVIVESPGDDEEEATDRAHAVFEAAREVIRTAKPVTDVEMPYQVAAKASTPFMGKEGERAVQIEAVVRIWERS